MVSYKVRVFPCRTRGGTTARGAKKSIQMKWNSWDPLKMDMTWGGDRKKAGRPPQKAGDGDTVVTEKVTRIETVWIIYG